MSNTAINKRVISFALFCFVLIISFACMIFSSGSNVMAAPADESTQEIRVISINLCCDQDDIEKRGPILLNMFLDMDPDVIGTQENGLEYSAWMQLFKEYFPNYGRIGKSGEGLVESRKIMANYIYYNADRYECLEWDTQWLGPKTRCIARTFTGNYPSTVTWGIFRDKESGFKFAHVNCHTIYNNEEENYKQMVIVADMVEQFAAAGMPVFATGDYNTSEGGEAYQNMMSRPGVGDPKYLTSDTVFSGSYRGWGYRDLSGGRPIDFCFVSKDTMTVNKYDIIETYAQGMGLSDHNAVYVSANIKYFDDAAKNAEAEHKLSLDIEVLDSSTRAYVHELHFSQVSDVKSIFYYIGEIYDKSGKLIDSRMIRTNNLDQEIPEDKYLTFGALDPDTDYTVKLYGCTIAGTKSLPYEYKITTMPEDTMR